MCVCTLLEKVCANSAGVFMYFVCIKTLVKSMQIVCVYVLYIYFYVMYIFNI